jgi:hypothetical protein
VAGVFASPSFLQVTQQSESESEGAMRYQIEDIQNYLRRFYGTARLLVQPFGYPIAFNENITSGTSFLRNVNIQANADFLLTGVSYQVLQSTFNNVGDKQVAIATIDFRESGSKEPFTDLPVFLENYAENGIGSRNVDFPRFLAGGSNVECRLANIGPDAYASGIDVMLHGLLVRVFN